MIRRVLDRIAAWFGYYPREYKRIHLGGDAIARGARWEQFYTEEGGLADMLRAMRQELFEDWAEARFGDVPTRDRLAVKDEAIRDLARRVQTVVDTGKLRASEQAQKDRIAAIRR